MFLNFQCSGSFSFSNTGYYQTGTDTYDIKWSMPHCVLTLRLIGLCLDYYDGRKKPEQLTDHQKKMALTKAPSLLEMFGQVYFPGGFLVGPQFSMKRYLDFTSHAFDKVISIFRCFIHVFSCIFMPWFLWRNQSCQKNTRRKLSWRWRLFSSKCWCFLF